MASLKGLRASLKGLRASLKGLRTLSFLNNLLIIPFNADFQGHNLIGGGHSYPLEPKIL